MHMHTRVLRRSNEMDVLNAMKRDSTKKRQNAFDITLVIEVK